MRYVDYTGRIAPEDLLTAGVSGVSRYLSWLPNPKVIGAEEYAELVNGGIDVVLNWEYDSTDWLTGASVGKSHAAEAVRQAKALGYPPGKPLTGSCDLNITRTEWDSFGKYYAAAFAQGIQAGGYAPGVYGPWDALQWCKDEIPEFGFFWQAGMSWAWTDNAQDWPGANLIQRAHMAIAGEDTDYSDVMKGWQGMRTLDDIYNLLVTPSGQNRVAWIDGRVKAIVDGDPVYFDPANQSHPNQLKAEIAGQSVTLTADQLTTIEQTIAESVGTDTANAVMTLLKDQFNK